MDNNGLNDIISKLTQNPEMMKNLMNVAGNIMGENKAEQNSFQTHKEQEKHQEIYDDSCNLPHRKRGDDAENLICLLIALKPYVSADRCSKIDSIVKILKLVQLSEKTGILKSLL